MGEPVGSVEVEAESVDEAISQALLTLGLAREQVNVEILQEARRNVLGFGGAKARVRVAARAAAARGPASVDDGGGPAILRRLLELMDIPAEVDATPAEETGYTWLRISSAAGGLLIGRHGQTLDALEYLVNRLGTPEEQAGRYLVDAEGYRERRSRELRETAMRLAAAARRTSRPQAMDPLGARERRIVHLALSEDTTVRTESTGEGALRRVVIHPVHPPKGRAAPPR